MFFRRENPDTANWNDSSKDYLRRLGAAKRGGLSKFDFDRAVPINIPVTPFGINFTSDLPLFRTPPSQKSFDYVVDELRETVPNQYFNNLAKTHVCLCIGVRNSPKESKDSIHYFPNGDKSIFYREYLSVLDSLNFRPFTLKADYLSPVGILLFRPEDNPEAIFDLRKQIVNGLRERTLAHEKPNGLIHATLMRPFDLQEMREKMGDYIEQVTQINHLIYSGDLFGEPISIDQVALVEPHVNQGIIHPENYYTDEIIGVRYSN